MLDTAARRGRGAGIVVGEWHRLSAWSIVQFSTRSIAQHIRLAYVIAPASVGAARFDWGPFAWLLPVAAIAAVLVAAVLNYVFYAYRLRDGSIEVRQGAFHRRHLDLDFERIQNISIEQAFYYRPLGLVTLEVDSAGSSSEEVRIIAIRRDEAEALRRFVRDRRDSRSAHEDTAPQPESEGERFFTRSIADLVVHGLTNNRAFLAVAAILGFASQANLSPAEMIARLGIDFDIVVAGMSMVQLGFVIALSFLLVTGVVALLSVLVSILVYFGFTLYRSDSRLVVARGLVTRHEMALEKSRIQTILLRQDWLDHVLGRCNVILEPISHRRSHGGEPGFDLSKRILVPSVRVSEVRVVTDEIVSTRPDVLIFTPARKRYFYKHAVIFSALYAALLAGVLLLGASALVAGLVLAGWALHMPLLYMSWKRKGLAVDGEHVVVRSGMVGIDYTIFLAHKLQDVTHAQSLLMRRRRVSTLVFHTASATVRAPYLGTEFAKSVVDYCLYRIEAGGRPWM